MRVDATHAEETMPTGLVRRGARYYLRRRVPLDLVVIYGRNELTKALGTSDYAIAKKLLAKEWVKLDEQFDAKRAGLAALQPEPSPPPAPMNRLDRIRQQSGQAKAPTLFKTLVDAVRSVDLSSPSGATKPQIGHGSKPRRENTVTWEQVVARWAAERKPVLKTQKAYQAVANEFTEIVGDIPFAQLEKRHGLAFKDGLIANGVTSANLKTKLSRLKTLVNYGYDNDLISTKIMEGIRAPKSKSVGRKPYSDQALQQLFSGPVHAGGSRPIQGRGEASYWLPLIAAYSGARLEEIAGLRVSDVTQLALAQSSEDESAWFFRFVIVPEANRRLKTEQSERETPIHPELIRLGLTRYAQSISDSGETQLFPLLTAQASGQRANKWGEWFGKYRRTTCGVDDDKIDFHSFRHTFKDACREARIPEGLQRQMMGHEAKDVADGYGSGFSRRAAVEAIATVQILGLPNIKPAA